MDTKQPIFEHPLNIGVFFGTPVFQLGANNFSFAGRNFVRWPDGTYTDLDHEIERTNDRRKVYEQILELEVGTRRPHQPAEIPTKGGWPARKKEFAARRAAEREQDLFEAGEIQARSLFTWKTVGKGWQRTLCGRLEACRDPSGKHWNLFEMTDGARLIGEFPNFAAVKRHTRQGIN